MSYCFHLTLTRTCTKWPQCVPVIDQLGPGNVASDERCEKEGKPESDILGPSISCIIERNKVEGYLFGVSHAYLTDERADVDEQVEELANN